MPYHVRKVKDGKWAIVNSLTGHVTGHSSTKANASRSASVRNQAHAGKKGKGKA